MTWVGDFGTSKTRGFREERADLVTEGDGRDEGHGLFY